MEVRGNFDSESRAERGGDAGGGKGGGGIVLSEGSHLETLGSGVGPCTSGSPTGLGIDNGDAARGCESCKSKLVYESGPKVWGLTIGGVRGEDGVLLGVEGGEVGAEDRGEVGDGSADGISSSFVASDSECFLGLGFLRA